MILLIMEVVILIFALIGMVIVSFTIANTFYPNTQSIQNMRLVILLGVFFGLMLGHYCSQRFLG